MYVEESEKLNYSSVSTCVIFWTLKCSFKVSSSCFSTSSRNFIGKEYHDVYFRSKFSLSFFFFTHANVGWRLLSEVTCSNIGLCVTEEAKLPVRRSHIGNEAYLDQMVIANSIHTEKWETLVPMTRMRPGGSDTRHHFFKSANTTERFSHIRLNLFPDGGVARLRAYGTPQYDWSSIPASDRVDLVALTNGGTCLAFSDAHFGHPKNLIAPGRGVNMADGWETARRADRPAILEGSVFHEIFFSYIDIDLMNDYHMSKTYLNEREWSNFPSNGSHKISSGNDEKISWKMVSDFENEIPPLEVCHITTLITSAHYSVLQIGTRISDFSRRKITYPCKIKHV